MKVTIITDTCEQQAHGKHLYTDEQLNREYNYILAERLTKKMLEAGLISEGEFNKIMAENREIFSPFLADILA